MGVWWEKSEKQRTLEEKISDFNKDRRACSDCTDIIICEECLITDETFEHEYDGQWSFGEGSGMAMDIDLWEFK